MKQKLDEISVLNNHDAYCVDWYRRLIVDGLAEDGQRIAVEMYDKVVQLQSKNAELEAMLEKAVELPLNSNSIVYVIEDDEIHNVFVTSINFAYYHDEDVRMYGIFEEDNEDFDFGLSDIGKTVFLTREEAESALNATSNNNNI